MNRENRMLCLVFPMGIEAYPFLHRVEPIRRWAHGKATYREVFFEGRRLLVVRCGVGPARAEAAIRMLDEKPSCILSVGTAGALDGTLRIGDLVVASETLGEGDPSSLLPCSPEFGGLLKYGCRQEGRRFTTGPLITVTGAVFAADERRKLHEATGAVAVDMESHALALKAREMNIPFACLRVVSDDLSSSRAPRKPDWKLLRRDPLRFPALVSQKLYHWRFMRKFTTSIELLHPVLVRVVRCQGNGFV